MESDSQQTASSHHDRRLRALPPDVAQWLGGLLTKDERLAATLFSDILAGGGFGEGWVFLTNRRLLVLSPNGSPNKPDVRLEIPIERIEGGEVREYVGSEELVIRERDRGHEIARLTSGGREEALDLVRHLKEFIKARKEGREPDAKNLTGPKRPSHRCVKCGAALRHATSVCTNCIDTHAVAIRLLSYLYPFRWYAALGLTLTLTMTALHLAPPYLTKTLLDDIIIGGNVAMLKYVILALVAVLLSRTIITGFRTYTMQWLGNRVLLDMKKRVFNHLQLLPLAYYNQKQTGEIMSRVTSDLSRLQYFIAEGFQDVLVNLTTVFLIAGILLFLNWELFLLAMAPVPIIMVSTGVFGEKIHRIYHRVWRRAARVSAILTDTIPGIRVVKSFAQENREAGRFSQTADDQFSQELRATRLAAGFYPFLSLMTGLGSVLIFSFGGYMVLSGETTAGTLMAFTGYLWQFYNPIQSFGQINDKLQHCITSAERVFEILDSDIEPVHNQGGIILSPIKGHIEFRNVRFGYEHGKAALRNLNFAVEPGEMIGLVGPSGAGKSTLVHLIARFYDATEGDILIDGVPIEDLDLWNLREQIGVVLQEPYLFHGTIWENIAYARADATADEIIEAARAANAHDFILNLPDGYDSIIGERGQTVSGGERQRLSIARAILRNPRILILDEATASVDTETEVLIQLALERLVENRTTFAIAHRLSTLRKANRLLVLERGKMVEMGTHEELLATGGLYQRLVNAQSQLSKIKVL